jgi:hypothetical protein
MKRKADNISSYDLEINNDSTVNFLFIKPFDKNNIEDFDNMFLFILDPIAKFKN